MQRFAKKYEKKGFRFRVNYETEKPFWGEILNIYKMKKAKKLSDQTEKLLTSASDKMPHADKSGEKMNAQHRRVNG